MGKSTSLKNQLMGHTPKRTCKNSTAFYKSVLKFSNIGGYLHDLEVGKDFLARTKKALTIKGTGTKPQTQQWLLTRGNGEPEEPRSWGALLYKGTSSGNGGSFLLLLI